MRFLKPASLALLACCGAARALSIDGEPQLHAAVGQPLSVSVPVSLAGDELSRIYYRLTPAAGLADAEERAAAAVHASYDPAGPAIQLSTATRVTVPAIRLHLEVGAGSVVVSRDLTVLFDIPDLSQSAPLDQPAAKAATKDQNDARDPLTATAAPEGTRAVAIRKEEDQKTPVAFGDAAAHSSALAASAAPQAASTQMVIAPRPRYFNTYQVKKGDTLSSIAAHLSRAGAGEPEAVMLAVFEANIDQFPAGDPMHPIPGRQLGIPDAASISSEPHYRITEFKDYLRRPVGEWQTPVTLQPKPVEPVEEAKPKPLLPWRYLRILIGLAALLLVLTGLRRLFSGGGHARAVAARRSSISGGAPVVQPNMMLLAKGPELVRELPVQLMAPPAAEAEQTEIARLRELLDQQPARADLRLRLAQRLYEARRAAGFADVALPLEDVLSPDAWERVRAMGHELLPSDFRFLPADGSAQPAPDLHALLEHKPAAVPSPQAPPAAAIDFDFHDEMERVDKARREVFGSGGKQAA